MKNIFTLLAFLVSSALLFAQEPDPSNGCTKGTLSINLNTTDTIRHKVNTAYVPVQANAVSSIYPATHVSLTRISDVNPYKPGIYQDCFTATDAGGLTVTCCRTVIIEPEEPTASIESMGSQTISVYPNPVIGQQFAIRLGKTFSSGNIDVMLYDLMGREILNKTYATAEGSIVLVALENQTISKGFYRLIVQQGGFSAVKMIGVE